MSLDEVWLRCVYDEAKTAWPGIDVSQDEYRQHLSSKIARLPADGSYRSLKTVDLYLTCACSKKNAKAVAAFDRRYRSVIDRAVSKMSVSSAERDEIRDALWERLLAGRGGRAPEIAEYAGRGDLGGWLRSMAVHAALKVRKREERHERNDEALNMLVSDGNPEVEYLRARHATRFQEALVPAMSGLPVRQRNLLRQHYIDGLSLEALASLYQVHRATVARWLADARETVLTSVRESLRARGALTDSELDSLLRMARSGFHISVASLFRTPT